MNRPNIQGLTEIISESKEIREFEKVLMKRTECDYTLFVDVNKIQNPENNLHKLFKGIPKLEKFLIDDHTGQLRAGCFCEKIYYQECPQHTFKCHSLNEETIDFSENAIENLLTALNDSIPAFLKQQSKIPFQKRKI